MRNIKLSAGSTLVLAVFASVLFLAAGIAAAQQETVLYSFNPSGVAKDGGNPQAALIFDAAGNLYGTTYQGGAYRRGTVFELTPTAGGGWEETILHSFGGGEDGFRPQAGLVLDGAGNLFGTTSEGGAHASGTVFELTSAVGGGWTERILNSFGSSSTEGINPVSVLVFDSAGNLYGTTLYGGAYDRGTAFELKPDGANWKETILHDFGSGSDGVSPSAGLVFDAAGNLYGTTEIGGTFSFGTIFALTPRAGGSWTEKIVHNFSASSTDGGSPIGASLIFDTKGNLYGTTNGGGADSKGTVFQLSPSGSGNWNESILYSFDGQNGEAPRAGVILDAAGNLYGTTWVGGAYNRGVAFELIPTEAGQWSETILHSFGANGTDASFPQASLIFDPMANLYGAANGGGAFDNGAVFEITP
jgi:uncharacterized repeat protein (TIGR03803 family)